MNSYLKLPSWKEELIEGRQQYPYESNFKLDGHIGINLEYGLSYIRNEVLVFYGSFGHFVFMGKKLIFNDNSLPSEYCLKSDELGELLIRKKSWDEEEWDIFNNEDLVGHVSITGELISWIKSMIKEKRFKALRYTATIEFDSEMLHPDLAVSLLLALVESQISMP